MRRQNQDVQRIAIAVHGPENIAVIPGVIEGRVEHSIKLYDSGLIVNLILVRTSFRNFDNGVDNGWGIGSQSNLVKSHEWRLPGARILYLELYVKGSMRAALQGIRFVAVRRELWKYIWGPMAVAAMFYACILLAGWFALPPVIDRFVPAGFIRDALTQYGKLVVVALLLVFAGPIYLFLSGFFSSILWERLSLKVEEAYFGRAPNGRIGCGSQIGDSIARLVLSAFAVVLSLMFAWTGAIGAVVIAGFVSLMDFTACAFIRRGIVFPAQAPRALALRGAIGFGIGCGAISLVPFALILLLPGLVAGGTILCAKGTTTPRPSGSSSA